MDTEVRSLNTFLCVVGHHTRRPHSVLLTRSLTGVMLCQGKMFSALLCIKWRGTGFPLTLSIQVSLLFAEQGLTLEQRGSGNTVKGIYSALIHSWSFFFTVSDKNEHDSSCTNCSGLQHQKVILDSPLKIIGLFLFIWVTFLFLIQHSNTLSPMPLFSWPLAPPPKKKILIFLKQATKHWEQEIVEQKEKRLEQKTPNQNKASESQPLLSHQMSDSAPQAKQFVDDTPVCTDCLSVVILFRKGTGPCFELFTWKKAKQETLCLRLLWGSHCTERLLILGSSLDRITCWSCEAVESLGNKMLRSLQGSRDVHFTFSEDVALIFLNAFWGSWFLQPAEYGQRLSSMCVWDKGSRTIFTVVVRYITCHRKIRPMLI